MDEKFGMGAMGFGPLAGMTETMDFVKRAWSTFNLPSNMAPTLDLDEIDKRIADLRTVEQWLALNLGMLQSAIQGLEIQRGSIAALKAFGEAVGAPGGIDAGAAAAKAMAAMASMGGSHAAGAPAAAPGPSGPAPREAEADAAGTAESQEAPAGPFAQASNAAISPAAWWNLLQSQFSQVAQAALAGAAQAQAPAASGASAADARETKPRRPAARKPASGKGAARPRKPAR
ncbi:MAG: PhaM family polyhydroxyalkanoate granule multifunctional regulatory protein [Gammaproteobacteria bacterium]